MQGGYKSFSNGCGERKPPKVCYYGFALLCDSRTEKVLMAAAEMFGKYASFTDPVHKNSYKAISPLRPELSQAGRTVLISGGTTGIGYGIASGFVKASAARVIITGRRPDVVSQAVKDLKQDGCATEIIGFPCDVSSEKAVKALWDKLRADDIVVDVLVLSAVGFGPNKPLRDISTGDVWDVFDINVRAQLQMSERFYRQEAKGGSETKVSISMHTCQHGTLITDK